LMMRNLTKSLGRPKSLPSQPAKPCSQHPRANRRLRTALEIPGGLLHQHRLQRERSIGGRGAAQEAGKGVGRERGQRRPDGDGDRDKDRDRIVEF
jgi:hypothetical protein